MKFRKKPVVIEAEQFLPSKGEIPDGVISDGLGDPRKDAKFSWIIPTLEGPHYVSDGDWIITGVKGERYACKPDIFEMTYEPVYLPEANSPMPEPLV